MALFLRLLVIVAIGSLSLAHAADNRNLVVQNIKSGNRVALVIGNGKYQHSGSLPILSNPSHDAEDIATALRGFGFDVIERKDQSLEGMNRAIAEFSRKLGDSEAALFYFAGHGLQVKGQNYLIPVDANIETEARVQYVSVNVNQILDEMENGKSRANIVMIDACRNNPISGKFRSGTSRGLAPITSQPKGTVIVYATEPGNVAADGDGRNGLFTAGLLTAFKGTDLSLGGVLTVASEEVERVSGQKQTPYINGPATLQKTFQFAQAALPVPVAVTPEDALWHALEQGGDRDDYKAYLDQYPKGKYVALAKSRISKLEIQIRLEAARQDQETRRQEQEDWDRAQNVNTAEAYRDYQMKYPRGRFATQATARLVKLEADAAVRVESELWRKAQTANDNAVVQSYLDRYPNGRYASEARGKLVELKKQQDDRLGWDRWQEGMKAAFDLTAAFEGGVELKAAAWQRFLRAYAQDNPYSSTAKELRAEASRRMQQATEEGQRARDDAERKKRETAEAERVSAERERVAQASSLEKEALRRRQEAQRLAEQRAAQIAGDERVAAEQAKAKEEEAKRKRLEEQRRADERASTLARADVTRPAADRPSIPSTPVRVTSNGETFKDCPDCPEMVEIPAGSFQTGGSGAKPIHGVTITKPFALGKVEVTQGQWRSLMGYDPSTFSKCGLDCPVERVIFNDAQEYVKRLSQKTGKHYRLPSGTEWEYACRAGMRNNYCGSDTIETVGWFRANSGSKTHPVASKQANAWGLFDMTGNVWEWVTDCRGSNEGSAGEVKCSPGGLRGGSWEDSEQDARVASRFFAITTVTGTHEAGGFRVVRLLP